jgi:hypothetical protein
MSMEPVKWRMVACVCFWMCEEVNEFHEDGLSAVVPRGVPPSFGGCLTYSSFCFFKGYIHRNPK